MISSAEMALREGKKQKGWRRVVSSARIAHRFRPLGPHQLRKIAIKLFHCNALKEYLLVAQKDAETVKLFNVLD